jgi:predicted HTH domain antitoxin
MTQTATLELSDELLAAVGMSADEFVAEMLFLSAAKLFEAGRLSSGQAARLCGMARGEFLMSLGRIGVSAINLDPDDLDEDVRLAGG